VGPVGLIHVDAHCDVNEHMNNCAIAHGTVFRRALEDGCLDAKRVVQIGLRGSGHSVEDYAWPMSQVFMATALFSVCLSCCCFVTFLAVLLFLKKLPTFDLL